MTLASVWLRAHSVHLCGQRRGPELGKVPGAERAAEATLSGTACSEATEGGKDCHSRGVTVGFKLQPNHSLA